MWAVSFANDKSGWAVGDAGILLETSDGGQTWQRMPDITHRDLYALVALSPFTILSGSNRNYRYRSSDGGDTWEEIMLPFVPDALATSDSLNAVAGGFPGNLYALSEDSEQTWLVDSIVPASEYRHEQFSANAISQPSAGTIVSARSFGRMFRTITTGDTWESLQTTIVNTRHVFFLNENIGWVIGGGNTLMRTSNGGATWLRSVLEDTLDAVTCCTAAHRQITSSKRVLMVEKMCYIPNCRYNTGSAESCSTDPELKLLRNLQSCPEELPR